MLDLLPSARVGHVGLYRDPVTLQAVEYYFKVPQDIGARLAVVVDPMLATGNSSSAAIKLLQKSGVKINNIFLVSLLSAPEGIKYLESKHKKLKIFTGSLDEKLNNNKFIVPGLGDAGDRYMGT